MKKILALLLALVMVLGLVACAGDTTTNTELLILPFIPF